MFRFLHTYTDQVTNRTRSENFPGDGCCFSLEENLCLLLLLFLTFSVLVANPKRKLERVRCVYFFYKQQVVVS